MSESNKTARKERAKGKAARPAGSPQKKRPRDDVQTVKPKTFVRTGNEKIALMQDATDAEGGKFTVLHDVHCIMTAGDVVFLSKDAEGKSPIGTMNDYHTHAGEVHYRRL